MTTPEQPRASSLSTSLSTRLVSSANSPASPGKSSRASRSTFSAYQLFIAAFSPLSSLVTRSLHVGFLLLLAFLIHPISTRSDRHRIEWYDAAIASLAFALALYHWVFEAALVQRSGDPTTADLVVGTLMIVLLFEGARRVLGLALPIICALFLAYGLFGQYLPSAIAHRGYGFDQIVGALYLGTEGIYGIPTLVSATYIFLFILFGSFLEHAGMINLFNDIALGFVGHARGGPAKVAVISSGMMGTISGSGVANVLTVGSVHDSPDEALRVFVGLRRRGRGDRQHGRPDHAAGHGRGRVHHGGNAERALPDDRQGGGDSGGPVLRDGVLDGAPRGGPRRPRRNARRRIARIHGRRSGSSGT